MIWLMKSNEADLKLIVDKMVPVTRCHPQVSEFNFVQLIII